MLTAVGFPGIHILYSILNIIIGIPLITYVLYCGFTCAGKRDGTKKTMYQVLQGFLCIVYLLFIFLPAGPINGFPRIAELEGDDSGEAGFGIFSVVAESLTYMALTGLGGWCLWLIRSEAYKPTN